VRSRASKGQIIHMRPDLRNSILKNGKESKMFKNILVAYDESPESGRALVTGIHLAKRLNADLRAVSVQENLPPYAG
jgi:K+-sensing histidine kinase KdpD